MRSPERLVAVAGTGTSVGKTWLTAAVVTELRAAGRTVAVRKPVQSFGDDDELDAELLAGASGEAPHQVCPSHRSYGVPMAPPMAAAVLGREPPRLDELVAELVWPPCVDLGFVESVGGVRSPVADDGDSAELIRLIEPDLVLLVADAGLGTINLVRLSADALGPLPVLVALNRYDEGNDLHRRNREWLASRDGFAVAVSVAAVRDQLV
jgi:dethiobiotin synthetase